MQRLHVTVKRTFRNQRRAEALDRHIGDGKKMVKCNSKLFTKYALVVRLKLLLIWRQHRALWVVDEV